MYGPLVKISEAFGSELQEQQLSQRAEDFTERQQFCTQSCLCIS